MNWIKCSERMPPKDTPVLVYGGDDIGVDETKDGENWYDDGAFAVTHWMPLPNPPAAEKPGKLQEMLDAGCGPAINMNGRAHLK